MSREGPAGLTRVSDATLTALLAGLRSGAVRAPLTRDGLVAFGIADPQPELVRVLEGHSKSACESILEIALAERDKARRPTPELVWSGPEAESATARDTRVVLRELFESAQQRVVLAGYSFLNETTILGPLHQVMQARSITATFFVDIDQPKSAPPDPDAHGQAVLRQWMNDSWPFGPPFPEVHCDLRSLTPGPPWSSLHAKCVAVDGERAFVSSANFTGRAQARNIEVGVLLRDRVFASALEVQLMGLIAAGKVVRFRG